MNTHIIEKFHIIGITVRTSNDEGKAENDIPLLWRRFLSEGIMEKIPNRINNTIYCMYTDYEKDYTKPYTTIIGCKVVNLETIPDGMNGKTIETSNYIKYVAKGNVMQGVVQSVWQNIWNSDSDLDRAYNADFDVYGDKAQNLEHAEVDIFVSVK